MAGEKISRRRTVSVIADQDANLGIVCVDVSAANKD